MCLLVVHSGNRSDGGWCEGAGGSLSSLPRLRAQRSVRRRQRLRQVRQVRHPLHALLPRLQPVGWGVLQALPKLCKVPSGSG